MEKKYLSWDDIEDAVERLATNIKANNASIEAITGLPRGGLIPAVMLSHKLDIPYIDANGNFEEYDNILIVDDICDSGHTLKQHHQFFTTATLHYKTSAVVEPDFWWKLASENEWIVYPWEREDSKTIPDYATKGK
jgi:hypoxanthine phosphoribosyltransferase